MDKLIYNLQLRKDQMIKVVRNFDLLVAALHELNDMVEMDELKDSIVKQVKFLLFNTLNNNNDTNNTNNGMIFDGHMLHTVIYGPPGVGKTRVCIILVKIWMALGIINYNPKYQFSDPVNSDFSNYTSTNIPTEVPDKVFTNEKIIINEVPNIGFIPNKLYEPNNNLSDILNSDILNSNLIQRLYNLQDIVKDLKNYILNTGTDIEIIRGNLKYIKRLLSNNSNNSNDNIYSKINQRYSEVDNIIDNTIIKLNQVELRLSERVNITHKDEDIKFIQVLYPSNNNNLNNNTNTFDNNNPNTNNTNMMDNNNVMNIMDHIKIAGREDFVGGFLGQTALKTEKLLMESLGKVLFIDEAYSIVNDDKDSYGREALTVLNRFMSEHPDKLIVIFAGYKDLMEQTIFKIQPGLKSRCTWLFEIEGYTEKGLATIFNQQMKNSGWDLNNLSNIDLERFFKENLSDFPAYGRDTNRLVFYSKLCYTELIFDNPDSVGYKEITYDILQNALKYLQKNRIKDESEFNVTNMYL